MSYLMSRYSNSNARKTLGFAIGLATLVLGTVACAGAAAQSATDLKEELPVGENPDWYWSALEERGYEITSINYSNDEYVEYEVVKGEQTYEVKLSLDETNGKVTEVEIAANRWLAEETEEALTLNRETAVIPSGSRINASLNDYLDSGENQVGDTFTMTTLEPVVVEDAILIPEGSLISGTVTSVESARRPQKGGRLILRASRINVHGEDVNVDAIVTAETVEGEGSLKEDLKEIAVGAGLGGLVGGLLGGGKGALAGVLIGGGGTFLATKGEQIELPPDTQLVVELRADARVPIQ